MTDNKNYINIAKEIINNCLQNPIVKYTVSRKHNQMLKRAAFL